MPKTATRFIIKLSSLFVFSAVSLSGFGQYFSGKIIKCDTLKTPIYQAMFKAVSDNDSVMGQTYFDGSFKAKLKPSTSYRIIASYSGYTDSVILIKTDNKGNPSKNNLTFCLRKDGMRLMGYVINATEEIPINRAVLILKNIVNKTETQVTTSIDGYYNFKLDYEANYQLRIDKYSPGIMNSFQDTSFYISTIGFNLPLDFKLDIKLGKSTEVVKPREKYQKKVTEKPLPVVNVAPIVKAEPPVVVQKEEPRLPAPAPVASAKEIKAKQDSVLAAAQKQAEVTKASQEAQAKRERDSVSASIARKDSMLKAATLAQQKLKQQLKDEKEARDKRQADSVSASNAKKDSLLKASTLAMEALKQKAKAEKEAQAKRAADSVSALVSKKDSLQRTALTNESLKQKAKAEKEAQAKRAMDSVTAAIAKKDSMLKAANLAQQKLKQQLKDEKEARDKRQADSVRTALATKDSLQKASVLAQENLKQKIKEAKADSIRQRQEQLAANTKKELEIAQNKLAIEKQKRIEDEGRRDDSLAFIRGKMEAKALAEKAAKIALASKIILKGAVLDGTNQRKLANVKVSIHPLNSIFSIEAQTNQNGYFEAAVDSGKMYIMSLYHPDYKISKQFVDVTNERSKEFGLQDILLTENDVEINRDMPAVLFLKNKCDLTENGLEELNAVSVLLKADPTFTIKIIGLAAGDEYFTKALAISRGQVVAQYLAASGINVSQIKLVSVAESKHRSNCGGGKPCTIDDYNKDRAVVYLITK